VAGGERHEESGEGKDRDEPDGAEPSRPAAVRGRSTHRLLSALAGQPWSWLYASVRPRPMAGSPIDTHVTHVLAHGGGDGVLLVSLANHLGTFKQLMEISTDADMNALCQRYDGLYRLANLLERLAEGSIPVPA
jgi:hypothetical protein